MITKKQNPTVSDRGSVLVAQKATSPAPYYGKILKKKNEKWQQIKFPASGRVFGVWANREKLSVLIIVKGVLIWAQSPSTEVFDAEINDLCTGLSDIARDPRTGKFYEQEQGEISQ